MKEAVITSSILIICIILLRRLCRGKISAGVQYALWLIVALRLIVPAVTAVFPNLLPESELSVMNLAKRVETSARDYIQTPEQIGQINIPLGGLPFVKVENEDGPTAVFVAGRVGYTWVDVFKGIWYAGIIIAGVWMATVNISFMRELLTKRTKYEKEDYKLPIYYVKDLASPCLYGLFGKQAVYLPEEVIGDEERVRHILAHEYCHYKHRDVLWAGLRCILLAVYWFNPLVWLAAVLSKRDCELACDEAAIMMLGEEERIAYGKTLLSLITKAPKASDIVCAATTMTGTGRSVKERINRIAKQPKRLAIILVPVLVVVGVIAIFTFTQAKEYPENAYLSEDGGAQLVTTDCFQINFPETIANEIYCIEENDTDVIIYRREDNREIGAFRRLMYAEAAALSDEKEVVPIGDYGKNWLLKQHMDGDDGAAGTDSNADADYTEHYYYNDSGDSTETAAQSNGGVEHIPAPEDTDSEIINLPYDENEDYSAVDVGENEITVQYEESRDYLPTEIVPADDVYLPNEDIATKDISDSSHSVDHIYIPNEASNAQAAGDYQDNAAPEESRDYLPTENIEEDSTTIMLPSEEITTTSIPKYEYCYIYVPADNSDAEESVQKELEELNKEIIDLIDSVTVLFMSMDSMEVILDILAGTHRSDVNDLANISEIAQTIPTAEILNYNMLESTASEPGTLTLHYRLLSNDITGIDKSLFVDAVLMFSLVEDLERCDFQINEDVEKIKYSAVTPDDYQVLTMSYERSKMEKLFGELYPCSETKEDFVALYNRVLEYLEEQE